MMLALLCMLLLHVCVSVSAEEKRGFGGTGSGSSQFRDSAFRDDGGLIDWKNVFHKRAPGGQQMMRFGDFGARGLERGDMVDWSRRYNKRGFAVDVPSLGDGSSSHFVNWNDYFGKRDRRRREAREDDMEKRFADADANAFGTGNYNRHFARNPMQFTDWREAFARPYRSFASSLPAFGDHANMVNWNDYFKRIQSKHIAKEEEKKDSN